MNVRSVIGEIFLSSFLIRLSGEADWLCDDGVGDGRLESEE